jgi:hypothetical protein
MKAPHRSFRCLGVGASLIGAYRQETASHRIWASLAQTVAPIRPDVDARAAHQLKALATPDAGAALASAPSARPPGDAAERKAMPATTATRSARLAPAGGLAAASAEAPAAGRVRQALEPLLAVLDALTQAADQALQAVGAGLRRCLAWRPWGVQRTPPPRLSPAATPGSSSPASLSLCQPVDPPK